MCQVPGIHRRWQGTAPAFKAYSLVGKTPNKYINNYKSARERYTQL